MAHRARTASVGGRRPGSASLAYASMQGVHATADAPFVARAAGDKRAEEGAYVWQRLMQSGAVVTNGTDARGGHRPARQLLRRRHSQGGGRHPFYAEQTVSRLDALRSARFRTRLRRSKTI